MRIVRSQDWTRSMQGLRSAPRDRRSARHARAQRAVHAGGGGVRGNPPLDARNLAGRQLHRFDLHRAARGRCGSDRLYHRAGARTSCRTGCG